MNISGNVLTMFLTSSATTAMMSQTTRYQNVVVSENVMILKAYNQFKEELWQHNRTISIVLISLYVIVFLAGIVGNVAALVAFACNRRLRAQNSTFLVNLLVSDLLGKSNYADLLNSPPGNRPLATKHRSHAISLKTNPSYICTYKYIATKMSCFLNGT